METGSIIFDGFYLESGIIQTRASTTTYTKHVQTSNATVCEKNKALNRARTFYSRLSTVSAIRCHCRRSLIVTNDTNTPRFPFDPVHRRISSCFVSRWINCVDVKVKSLNDPCRSISAMENLETKTVIKFECIPENSLVIKIMNASLNEFLS